MNFLCNYQVLQHIKQNMQKHNLTDCEMMSHRL